MATMTITRTSTGKSRKGGTRNRKRKFIFRRDKGKCFGCRKYVSMQNGEVDHIKPASCGGGNDLDNLRWSCHPCNIGAWREVRTPSTRIERITGDYPLKGTI